MATWRVKPIPKSVIKNRDSRSNKRWQLLKSGSVVSRHQTKQEAVNSMESRARKGDTLKTETKSGSVSTRQRESKGEVDRMADRIF